MRSRRKQATNPGKGRGTKGKRVADAGRSKGETGQLIVLSERDANQTLQPCHIPLLPLRSDVVFPQTVVPLVINRPSGIRLIDDCMIGERMVGLVSQLHPETDSPGMDDLFPMVCVGLDPQDAQVPRRLDADRLPGAIPGPAGGGRADRALPDRPGRAVRGSRRGRGRARRPGAPREPVLPADGRPEPADPRGASGRGDQHPRAGPAGRPAGLEPAVHDRGEAEPPGRDQRPGPAGAAGAVPVAAARDPRALDQDPGAGRQRAHQGPARPFPPPADQGDPGRAGREREREPRDRRAVGADQEGQPAAGGA